jgi:hypothetical protein
MGCATNTAKYLFFAVNFIFFILGIAVLGVGIYSRVENDTWKDLIDTDTMFAAANLLIAGGVIVAIIGFFGCCGAIKEVNWMLIIYSIIVILIFILEIAGGAFAYTKRDLVEEKMINGLTKTVTTNYGVTDNIAAKGLAKALDWFQENVKCCGVNKTLDWKTSVWYGKKGGKTGTGGEMKVPDSCCKTIKEGCGLDITQYSSPTIYQDGCVAAGKKFVKDNLYLVGGVGVGIAVVQLLSIVFAICLICAFRDAEKNGSSA